MKNFVFIIFWLISFNILAQQNGYYIQTKQLKNYSDIKEALKEPNIVYCLNIDYFDDSKIAKISNDTIKLKNYLNQICIFTNLYSISFDYLSLIEIPDLSSFEYLETISISRMQNLNWSEFLINVSKCKNLKYLKIYNCDTVNLKEEIGLLKKLEGISIEYSKKIYISDSIKKLLNLNEIHLNQNELTSLPTSIGLIPNLMEFNISANFNLNFVDAIEILSNCKKLEFLNLYGNAMTELPNNICLITSLKRLHIGNNQLKTLPMSLTEMPNLENIIWNFGQNTLSDLPDEFNEKIKLKKLENGNYIKE
jgi:Leucine-rich repeat (LRR) protein